MKILFVEQLGKNNWEYIYSAAKYIANDNEVTCYMSDTTPKNNINYNFKIVYGFEGAYSGNYFKKTICYLKSLNHLKKYIKKNNFDIVHFEWFSLPWIEWLYIKLLKKYCKIVITVNDVIPFESRFMEKKCLKKIYGYADAILLHTDDNLKLFNDVYRTNNYKSVITAAFRDWKDYIKVDKSEARKKLNIPNDKKVVLFFGTIRESKGLDVLIKAMKKVTTPDAFLLVGGAFHATDPQKYKKLVNECLNSDNSLINFGHIPDKDLKLYFSAADVLTVPYREIYQSGIAQFGLIYGLPIIGSDIPRLNEMVIENYNSLVFRNENSDDLAKKIDELLNDESKRRVFAENSHNLAIKKFSVEERAKRTVDTYKKILR